MLLEGGGAIDVTLEADSRADKAITDIINTGDTAISQKEIFDYFPVKSLDRWHDTVLRKICEEEIFPKLVGKFNYKIIRAVGDKMLNAPNDRIGGGVMSPKDSGDW